MITAALIADGHVSRGYLGATIQNLTPDLASSVGLEGRKGALIAELAPNGPAQRAGLHQGDVVLALDGRPLAGSTDLTRQVALIRCGRPFTLTIRRDGHEQQVPIVAGLRPSEQQLAQAGTPNADCEEDGHKGHAASLGMAFGPLNANSHVRTGDPFGVVVERVDPGSEAAEQGLQPGVVVFRIGDQDVRTSADVTNAVAAARRAGRGSILLGVRADGRTAFLALKLTREG